MTFASIHDIAASWELYEQTVARLTTPPPEGLVLQLAGPTDEGVRIIGVWCDELHSRRFGHECLVPAIDSLGGPVRPVWTVRGLRPAHVVLGAASPIPIVSRQEPEPC